MDYGEQPKQWLLVLVAYWEQFCGLIAAADLSPVNAYGMVFTRSQPICISCSFSKHINYVNKSYGEKYSNTG